MLTIWVIYYGASNHPPGKWVVRAQDAGVSAMESPDGIRRHAVFFECDSLEEARAKVPEGLQRMSRWTQDDLAIVETWF
jgi:hypothetical protein